MTATKEADMGKKADNGPRPAASDAVSHESQMPGHELGP